MPRYILILLLVITHTWHDPSSGGLVSKGETDYSVERCYWPALQYCQTLRGFNHEINPLVVLPNCGLLAVDAVIEVDDSALSRVRFSLPDRVDRIENPLERRGREIGVTYVDLDGDIGLISSGAGLGMASMDIIGEDETGQLP